MKFRSQSRRFQCFPVTRPLEFVFVDILGPFRKTEYGHEHLLVITDRYSKLTCALPLHTITAKAVAKAFCDHRVFGTAPGTPLVE